MTSGADNRIRRRKQLPDPSSTLGASNLLCAWHIGDGIWHVQSRNAWLSKVLREAKLRRIAYGVIGGHLTIWETKDFEAMRPLMRRHKGRILR
jgi:hypothetical protein